METLLSALILPWRSPLPAAQARITHRYKSPKLGHGGDSQVVDLPHFHFYKPKLHGRFLIATRCSSSPGNRTLGSWSLVFPEGRNLVSRVAGVRKPHCEARVGL